MEHCKLRYVDLHIHSKYSDGILSPQKIIDYAKANNIEAISITDHNTIDAYSQVVFSDKVKVVPGIEVDINYSPELQVLCYKFNLNDNRLLKALKYIQLKRMQAKIKLVRSLLKFKIIEKADLDKLCRLNDFDHICQFLETRIEGMTKFEIKETYFRKGKMLYQDIPSLELKDCLELIHNAGGIVILAHPGRIPIPKEELQVLFAKLLSEGLDGIECYHPDNDESTIQLIKEFCGRNGCMLTGGSDMHSSGTNFRVRNDSITKIW